MEWSRYNKLFKSDKYGYLLYNSLTNSFVELDDDSFSYLKSLEKKENIKIEDCSFFEELKQMKVLVDNDRDEFYNIKYTTHFQRFENGYLELTINPTIHCNFACPYCFEAHKPPIYMTDEVEDALFNFVQNQKAIRHIHVTWFGGEPLMAFDRMKSITHRMKQIDVKYTSKIITNGFLLTDKVIDSLNDLDVSSIQITIDGLKEEHDKLRCLTNGTGTFDVIIKNIDNLLSKNNEIFIGIRVNIDVKNAEKFIDVYKFFANKYRGKKIAISPGFISNESGCIPSDCIFDSEKKSLFLMKLYKDYGLNAMSLYPLKYRYECAIRNPHHLTIGPEGEIYKCWNDVGNPEKVVGSLINKELVNSKLLTRYYVAGDALENKDCQDCFLFPRCGGGCPYNRIENEFKGTEEYMDLCDYRKNHLEEFLELHYDFRQRVNAISLD